ncbi:hypothetical protein ZWY2020_052495 [Hordeum vulgare]|nr:hypothetical protein ZWY2020_052495 [Hordeum vulgare]
MAPWISSEMFDASWGFFGDPLTVVMLIVVTFISSLVHLYSISYMSEDPIALDLCVIYPFYFFMLMLVTGDNFLQLFWMGGTDKAAIKAMLVNRVGDFGLALGIFGCFTLFQTVDFSTIFLVLVVPLDSALIHAATMVTWRFHDSKVLPLFEYSPTALILIQLGQLGYMIFACGISNYSVSVFHLMNHQDMRKMGGLASSFPLTYAMMLMGSLSLIGFPFLTGFYSKDVILELAYTKYTISGNFAFWLGSVSVLFTSYYSFRLLSLTFLVPTHSFRETDYDVMMCPFLWPFL